MWSILSLLLFDISDLVALDKTSYIHNWLVLSESFTVSPVSYTIIRSRNTSPTPPLRLRSWHHITCINTLSAISLACAYHTRLYSEINCFRWCFPCGYIPGEQRYIWGVGHSQHDSNHPPRPPSLPAPRFATPAPLSYPHSSGRYGKKKYIRLLLS